MSIAVIGGAGYIGSHVVRLLETRGERVVLVDDLSTGAHERVGDRTILSCDIAAEGAEHRLAAFLTENDVSSVLHFAAKKQVAESVLRPMWYYQQNLEGTRRVLEAMTSTGVRDLVFSSTAAVYGSPTTSRVDEDTPADPINPYGGSKLASEWLVSAATQAHGLRTVSLRYFNVVGAGSPELQDRGLFNLVPIVINAVRRREPVPVFGTDYPTPDGSCVRDYVHVVDLADAHVAALNALVESEPGTSRIYNVGTGMGSSVLEVLDLVEKVTGERVHSTFEARRPGDPAALSADVTRIRSELGWASRLTLEDAIRSIWNA